MPRQETQTGIITDSDHVFKADKMLFTSDMVSLVNCLYNTTENGNSSFNSSDIYGVICSLEVIIKSK